MKTTTQEWVRDAFELRYPDGRFYATERLVTSVDDWREVPGIGRMNCGTIDLGFGRERPVAGSMTLGETFEAFMQPTKYSPRQPWWKRLLGR